MGVNSLPKTVTRQRRGCDLNPGPSAPESSTLTTRLPRATRYVMLCRVKPTKWRPYRDRIDSVTSSSPDAYETSRYAVRETGPRLMVAGGAWFDRDDATGRRAGAEKFLLCPSASRDGFINIGRARRSGRGAQVARESAAAAAPGRRGPGRPARNPEIRPRSLQLQLLSYARPDDSRLAAFGVSRQTATAKPRLKSWRGLEVGWITDPLLFLLVKNVQIKIKKR